MNRIPPASRETIVRLRRAGLSYYAIARETRHGMHAIAQACVEAGIPPGAPGKRSTKPPPPATEPPTHPAILLYRAEKAKRARA